MDIVACGDQTQFGGSRNTFHGEVDKSNAKHELARNARPGRDLIINAGRGMLENHF